MSDRLNDPEESDTSDWGSGDISDWGSGDISDWGSGDISDWESSDTAGWETQISSNREDSAIPESVGSEAPASTASVDHTSSDTGSLSESISSHQPGDIDTDELMEAGEEASETIATIADDPVNNNPITRGDDVATEIEHLQRVSRFLDNYIRIPGTNYHFGADSLSGLIPGIGDFLSSVFSVYIIYKAYLLGIPYSTIIRMGLNVVIDTLIGIAPVIGDLFDVAWKANEKNVELLEKRGKDIGSSKRDKWFAILFVTAPLLLVTLCIIVLAGFLLSII